MNEHLKFRGPPGHDNGVDDDYQQAYEERYQDFIDDLADHYGLKNSVWAIDIRDNITDFSEVPYPTAKTIWYDGGWGIENTLPLPPNANWIVLWRYADELIRMSGDHHHQYIERITWRLEKKDAGELELTTGS
jgi:hypothetical protein